MKFTMVFSVLMILAPGVFTLVWTLLAKRPQDAHVRRMKTLGRLLAVSTAIALALLVAALKLWPAGVRFGWTLFFPLWFGLAMPTIIARHPILWRQNRGSVLRTASLTPRTATRLAPRWIWLVGWAMWLTGVGVTLAKLKQPAQAGDMTQWWTSFAILIAIGPMPLVVTPFGIRLSMQEPEPLDVEGSASLREQYEALRRFKARGFLIGGLLLSMMTTAMMTAIAWGVNGDTLAMTGAVFGALLGVAGGAFGTVASFKRVRASNTLSQLTTTARTESG